MKQRLHGPRLARRRAGDAGRALLLAAASALASGCGQKGPLYLPDAGGEVVTRPTQTPAAEADASQGTAPAAAASATPATASSPSATAPGGPAAAPASATPTQSGQKPAPRR